MATVGFMAGSVHAGPHIVKVQPAAGGNLVGRQDIAYKVAV
jgi:hypothetical protein